MKVWFQNRLVPADQATVSVFDHSFLYGDGIYETVRAYGFRIFHWTDHFRRLKQSARALGLQCPWSSAYLLRALEKVLRANRQADASARITVSRGPGPLGLDPLVCPRPTLAIMLHRARPLQKVWKEGISIGIVRVRRTHPFCLDPRIKSNNGLNTLLAKVEARKMGVFEGVLLNLEGHLTEGSTSNIFFVRKGVLHTPAPSCGFLEGVTRAAILRLARRAAIPVREGRYTPGDLRRADEIFISSTTLEIAPVVHVKVTKNPLSLGKRAQGEGKRLFHSWPVRSGRPGPVTQRLHQLFQAQVKKSVS